MTEHARTRSLVALDIERWSSRTTVGQGGLKADLERLVDETLRGALPEPSAVRRQHIGDGLLLSFPASTPKPLLTQPFVESLDMALRRHVADAAPERRMRLRLALHAGDIVDDGQAWSGDAVVEACRLLDADVLRRVLAATPTSFLVVLVSNAWYDAVVRGGHVSRYGYEHVQVGGKDRVREGWVRVPGHDEVPGLRPEDRWAPPGSSSPEADDRSSRPAGRVRTGKRSFKIGKMRDYYEAGEHHPAAGRHDAGTD
jgi:hypothetical protein